MPLPNHSSLHSPNVAARVEEPALENAIRYTALQNAIRYTALQNAIRYPAARNAIGFAALHAAAVGDEVRVEGTSGAAQAATLGAVRRSWLRVQALAGRSVFARNVSIMLFGTVLGQAASVALAPLLTRIYGPDEWGVLSVFTAFVIITSVLAAMRYEIAISTARDETEAINLVAVCGLALALTTTLFTIVVMSAPRAWFDAIWLGPLADHRVLLPIGFLCLGAYYVMLYYATYQHAFSAISRTRISQGLSGPISQLGLGLLGAGAPGLAIGFVIGQSSGTLLLLRRLVFDRREVLRELSWARMRRAMVDHRHYALVASWAALIEAMGTNQILYVLVSALYSGRIAGFLFLSERVVSRPLSMISTSLLQVYMGEAGRTVRDAPDQLKRRFWQIALRQLVLASLWVGLIDLTAQFAFAKLFGAAWSDAVPYLQLMSIAFLGETVVQSVQHTLQILNRQVLAALWQVMRMVAVTGGIVICWKLQTSALGTILVYALLQAGFSIWLLALMAMSIERIQVRT